MHIEKCGPDQIPQWVALRCALWPGEDHGAMAREAPGMLAQRDQLVLLARRGPDQREVAPARRGSHSPAEERNALAAPSPRVRCRHA